MTEKWKTFYVQEIYFFERKRFHGKLMSENLLI
jgi:hypothetical protein